MFADRLAEAMDRVKEEVAQSVSYTPSGGVAVALSAVFEEVSAEKDYQEKYQTLRREGRLGFKTSDLGQNPAIDDTVVVATETWNVTPMSIEHGWAVCRLTKAADGDRVPSNRVANTARSLR